MFYGLSAHGARHFPKITDRKQREAAAECDLVRRFFGQRGVGTFVEVGANDPEQSSQTYHLERIGWQGVLVEPIPAMCEALRDRRPRSVVVQAACGKPADRGEAEFAVASNSEQSALKRDRLDFRTDVQEVITVPVKTLDDILDDYAKRYADTTWDFVSIDVEGMSLEVLEGFELERHRPQLLLIEDHLTDLSLHRHLLGRGYRLAKRTGLNNWYIPVGDSFELTDTAERFALWRKLYLRTWIRGLRFRMRRAIRRS